MKTKADTRMKEEIKRGVLKHTKMGNAGRWTQSQGYKESTAHVQTNVELDPWNLNDNPRGVQGGDTEDRGNTRTLASSFGAPTVLQRSLKNRPTAAVLEAIDEMLPPACSTPNPTASSRSWRKNHDAQWSVMAHEERMDFEAHVCVRTPARELDLTTKI